MKKPLNKEADMSGIMYYIRFWNKDIEFWKIGITRKTIDNRFWSGDYSPKYNLNKKVIFEYKNSSLYSCYLEEQEILKKQLRI